MTLDIVHIGYQIALAGGSCVIGYILGRLERRTGATKPARQRWRELAGTVLALAAVVAVGVTVFQVQTRAGCQLQFSRAVSAAIAERSAANGAATVAQRELAEASLTGNPAVQAGALRSFITALDEQEAARRAAPLPAPPEC